MADGARGRASTRSARRAEVAAVDAPVVSFARSAMATQMRFEPSETPFASPRVGSRSTPSARYRPRSCTRCYDRAREFFALPSDVKKCYLHTQYEQETGGCVRASRPASSATPRGRSPFRILV